MQDAALVLGIETSCDETAAAVVARAPSGRGEILSSVVLSQIEEHAPFGGVVPEIAARAHVETLDAIVERALAEAGVAAENLSAIAATCGPGLQGGLLVGAMTGKAMAFALGKPFLAINHLEAHALTVRLTDALAFPFLMLLVSGGHTQILLVEGVGRYRRLATTIDDAVGEAFDKVAKLLGLPYPGGPAVEREARTGNPARFDLPRPMVGRAEPHFSFSGLKTAVRRAAEPLQPLNDVDIADICAGFQAAVAECLVDRVDHALRQSPKGLPLVVAGGVAANQAIRAALKALAERHGGRLVAPPPALCADNGVMIAWAGAERLALGLTDSLDAAVRPRWPLDPGAEAARGAGAKA
ncbi:MAG: tRNA (adenosine(37)-N6)-threonylcarbamoyltransferase complex transferase subunit TsaD [Flavobacteriaceae bacterium]